MAVNPGRRVRIPDRDEILRSVHLCASHRWAVAVAKAVVAPFDPKTLDAWSGLVAASPGVVRAWCSLADVRPKQSLDLARLLRLVVRNELHCAEECLDIVDPRTMTRLLRVGGIPARRRNRQPILVDEFLAGQTLVQSATCLQQLRAVLREVDLAPLSPR